MGDVGRSPRSPSAAVVIVNWNTREFLRACLRSVESYPPSGPYRVFVVDNASADGSADMVAEEFPTTTLIRNQANLGFARACNQAIEHTSEDVVILLNSDAEVLEGALDAVIDAAARWCRPVAGRLLNPDGTLQPSCFRFPGLGRDLIEAVYLHRLLPRSWRGRLLWGGYWDHDSECTVEWAIGAFLAVPRRALDAAGLLPEEYELFGEDMEWCWRLREAGFPVRFLPSAEVVHHGNRSAGLREPAWRVRRTHAAQDRFLEAHYGRVHADAIRAAQRLGYRVRRRLLPLIGRGDDGRRYDQILSALEADTDEEPL